MRWNIFSVPTTKTLGRSRTIGILNGVDVRPSSNGLSGLSMFRTFENDKMSTSTTSSLRVVPGVKPLRGISTIPFPEVFVVPLTGIAPLLYEYIKGIPKTLLLLKNDEIVTLSVYLLLSKSLISFLWHLTSHLVMPYLDRNGFHHHPYKDLILRGIYS